MRQSIMDYSKIMPNGGRYIQASPGIKEISRQSGLAKYEVEVILAARSDILPLRKAGEFIPSDFDPTILQKRGKADSIPGNTSSGNLEIVAIGKLPIGERHVEGIFLGSERCWPITISDFRVINAAVTPLPIFVPIAFVVRNEIVFSAGGFADPKEGRH